MIVIYGLVLFMGIYTNKNKIILISIKIINSSRKHKFKHGLLI